MNRIFKTLAGAAAIGFVLAATSATAEPIVGNWKTAEGNTAAISACGGSFCIKLKTGKYSGKSIGKLKGKDGKYTGTIADPANDREYSGSAQVSGSSMKLKGCALRIFCRTQSWSKL